MFKRYCFLVMVSDLASLRSLRIIRVSMELTVSRYTVLNSTVNREKRIFLPSKIRISINRQMFLRHFKSYYLSCCSQDSDS